MGDEARDAWAHHNLTSTCGTFPAAGRQSTEARHDAPPEIGAKAQTGVA